jgi:hypothetical protein
LARTAAAAAAARQNFIYEVLKSRFSQTYGMFTVTSPALTNVMTPAH